MTPPGSDGSAGRGLFLTTRWSIILSAAGAPTPASRESLARLCESYWQPVYVYVRRRTANVEDAQDLTQQFFQTFLEKHVVRMADPARGRFRSFLLASVGHFLSNEWDRQRARKRGGGVPLLPLEFETAEGVMRREPATNLTPEREFEQRWAIELVHRILQRLTDEQSQAGKRATFETLRPYLACDREGESYVDAAAALHSTPGAIRVAVHRLRRRLRALLLEEVANTVSAADDVQDELRYLIRVLRFRDGPAAEGRP